MKYFMLSEVELKNIISSSFEEGWYEGNNKTSLSKEAMNVRDYIIFKKMKNLQNERETSLDGN